jgi:hypothetical protein
MSIDLTSYQSIQSNLFVKISLTYTSTVLLFSDNRSTIALGDDVYVGLGQLMGVTSSSSDIKNTDSQVTVTISGIPDSSLQEIMNSRIKGSRVNIYRVFFDAATEEPLAIAGNPAGKFQGIVSNYNISDELDMGSSTGSIVLTLTVTSVVSQLENKLSGRRTNPADFATESSMNRVSALAKSNFNFGAPT